MRKKERGKEGGGVVDSKGCGRGKRIEWNGGKESGGEDGLGGKGTSNN